ncbi:ABC transporter ATP-binding protein [Streptomyces sp. NPDC059443]|uniref:ABC transporter ATP-binding protein n=1 Tax=unclassified Streptomyces TaxID=2593676 RepID=UPI00368782DF
MTASSIAIDLRTVSKAYGPAGTRRTVIDGVDLKVTAGEFVCLLGASGSGKSTLLSLVAGLERASSGDVRVCGPRPAMLFQDHALFPWLTAGENVELALRLRGVAKADRVAEAGRLLDLVRLGDAYGQRVHELSGGMRQRVALARALAQGTEVLLMDEPFAALDPITRELLHGELTRVWADRQLTVLFVTHDVHEAVRLGDRVVLLSSHPGRVAREWTVGAPRPRRADDPAVTTLAHEITDRLQEEIGRDARH